MKFEYTALNPNNQSLNGLLEATDIEAAKEQLHKMNLSILMVLPISDENYLKRIQGDTEKKQSQGILTFIFEANDAKGKPVNGTIDATDDFSALRRLSREYQFEVITLYKEAATEAQKIDSKALLSSLKANLSEEEKNFSNPANPFQDEDLEALSLSENALKQKVIQEVDQIIHCANEVLSQHGDLFALEQRRWIDKKKGELERIRQSNNFKHIAEVCNDLYQQLKEPEQLKGAVAEEKNRYSQIVTQLGRSALINKESDIYQKALGFHKIHDLGQSILESMQHLTASKQKKSSDQGFLKTLRQRFRKIPDTPIRSSDFTAAEKASGMTGLKEIMLPLRSLLSAKNKLERQTYKDQLRSAFANYKQQRNQKKQQQQEKKQEKAHLPDDKVSRTAFFLTEIESFFSWLLAFYLIYLFLALLSLERRLILSPDFVIKTLESPLIINITIFLFITHFLSFIRKRFFSHHVLASLFWFGFGYGCYFILIFNF